MRTLAVWVLNVYSVRASAPQRRRKRADGTMKCVFRFIAQMEQLQSHTMRSAGASTSHRTALQWQPPVCVTSASASASAAIPRGDPNWSETSSPLCGPPSSCSTPMARKAFRFWMDNLSVAVMDDGARLFEEGALFSVVPTLITPGTIGGERAQVLPPTGWATRTVQPTIEPTPRVYWAKHYPLEVRGRAPRGGEGVGCARAPTSTSGFRPRAGCTARDAARARPPRSVRPHAFPGRESLSLRSFARISRCS